MLTDRVPPGNHPADDTLLLLGDVFDDAGAGALVDELRADPETTDDPLFGPVAAANAWSHLDSCQSCSTRRQTLMGHVVSALLADPTDGSRVDVDTPIARAVAALVPNPGAVPPTMTRRVAPGRRRLFGNGAGAGASSGRGGVLIGRRPLVAAAAVAFTLIGVVVALQPGTSQKDAIAPATSQAKRAAESADTIAAAAETIAAAETPNAAPTEVAVGNPAMEASAAETAAPPPAADAADATDALPSATVTVTTEVAAGPAGVAAPAPAPPQSAVSTPVAAPPPTTIASTFSRAKKAVVATAAPTAVSPSPAPVAASVAASAAASAASIRPEADLGAFAFAVDALDRFASTYPSTGPTSSASPSAAAPTAIAVAEPTTMPCPQSPGTVRAMARIGELSVIIVRVTDATSSNDVVLDARTCVEIARRPSPPPL